MLQKNWGRIVFISSESGVNIPVEMIHYGVTKTAQIALARGLAETTAGTGVTVNSVLPGPTRSEGVEQFVEDLAKTQGTDAASVEAGVLPLGASLLVAEAICDPGGSGGDGGLRVQPSASATNGAALRVDGGVRPVHRVRTSCQINPIPPVPHRGNLQKDGGGKVRLFCSTSTALWWTACISTSSLGRRPWKRRGSNCRCGASIAGSA